MDLKILTEEILAYGRTKIISFCILWLLPSQFGLLVPRDNKARKEVIIFTVVTDANH